MTEREKLIKSINESGILCDSCGENTSSYCAEAIADHLLANGVIVPPCKVGDVVYEHNNHVWTDECCDCEHFFVGGFGDPNECGRTEDGLKHPDCVQIKESVVTQHDILFNLCFDKFGKTVFLSYEDAEKALKGGE